MLVNPSFQTFPLQALRDLVQKDAGLAQRNKRQARALLKDEFPEYGLQVEVLSAGLETDVPTSLRTAAERRALTIEAGRLAQVLVSRYGFQEYMARWSIAAWAFALGYWDEQAVSSTLTASEPAVAMEIPGPPPVMSAGETRTDGEPPPSNSGSDGAGQVPPDGGPGGSSPSPESGASVPRSKRSGVSRNILIGSLVLVLVVVGSVVGVKMTNAFGPGPAPTPVPTATPTATPAPTATPTPTPVPTLNPAAVESADVATIRSHGYVATTKIPEFAFTPDGSGGTLYGWAAICANTGDGYCAKVFFFHGKTLLGSDTAANSLAINSVESAGTGVIDVTYANYKPNDPNCCPSGVPVTISYTWNGTSMTASGTPPGH